MINLIDQGQAENFHLLNQDQQINDVIDVIQINHSERTLSDNMSPLKQKYSQFSLEQDKSIQFAVPATAKPYKHKTFKTSISKLQSETDVAFQRDLTTENLNLKGLSMKDKLQNEIMKYSEKFQYQKTDSEKGAEALFLNKFKENSDTNVQLQLLKFELQNPQLPQQKQSQDLFQNEILSREISNLEVEKKDNKPQQNSKFMNNYIYDQFNDETQTNSGETQVQKQRQHFHYFLKKKKHSFSNHNNMEQINHNQGNNSEQQQNFGIFANSILVNRQNKTSRQVQRESLMKILNTISVPLNQIINNDNQPSQQAQRKSISRLIEKRNPPITDHNSTQTFFSDGIKMNIQPQENQKLVKGQFSATYRDLQNLENQQKLSFQTSSNCFSSAENLFRNQSEQKLYPHNEQIDESTEIDKKMFSDHKQYTNLCISNFHSPKNNENSIEDGNFIMSSQNMEKDLNKISLNEQYREQIKSTHRSQLSQTQQIGTWNTQSKLFTKPVPDKIDIGRKISLLKHIFPGKQSLHKSHRTISQCKSEDFLFKLNQIK